MDKIQLRTQFYDEFVANLQQILATPTDQVQNNYLDLGQVKQIKREELAQVPDLPRNDPLEIVFELLSAEIQKEHLQKVSLGFNEYFKSYLRKINEENAETLTHQYFQKTVCLFRKILAINFCFIQEIWLYLCSCFKTIGLFLLEQNLIQGSLLYWDYIAKIGNIAARHSLHTQQLQRSMRILEVQAKEDGYEELAATLNSLRIHLEN
ncbi:hypothetical protein RDV78_00395 [Bacillota bacterium LX-D]|nr:hypothetical protein [Bacillota bacterium LX-D]